MNKRKITIAFFVLVFAISSGLIGCSNTSPEDESRIPESVVNEDTIDTLDSTDEQPENIEVETIDTVPADSNEENDTFQNNTKELAVFIENTESIEEIIGTIDNYNGLTTLDTSEAIIDTIEPEEPVESTPTNTSRTDAEVKKIINDFANNFKNTSTFNTLNDEAAEYVDLNLDIIKKNPESDENLKTYIDMYKEGLYTEDMFIFALEGWISAAGPYGSGNVVIK